MKNSAPTSIERIAPTGNNIAPWKDACSRKDRSNPLPCPPGGTR